MCCLFAAQKQKSLRVKEILERLRIARFLRNQTFTLFPPTSFAQRKVREILIYQKFVHIQVVALIWRCILRILEQKRELWLHFILPILKESIILNGITLNDKCSGCSTSLSKPFVAKWCVPLVFWTETPKHLKGLHKLQIE